MIWATDAAGRVGGKDLSSLWSCRLLLRGGPTCGGAEGAALSPVAVAPATERRQRAPLRAPTSLLDRLRLDKDRATQHSSRPDQLLQDIGLVYICYFPGIALSLNT